MDTMPTRVWLRKCGGGLTLPGGKPYLTVTGDDRELPRHVEYVRADDVDDAVTALRSIMDLMPESKQRPSLMSIGQWYAARDALSKAEGHIGQELAPDPERRVNGNANRDEK